MNKKVLRCRLKTGSDDDGDVGRQSVPYTPSGDAKGTVADRNIYRNSLLIITY